ncbi:MAG: efflux transporter outer membrane subunit, partial [Tepidisphaerales bacterium]
MSRWLQSRVTVLMLSVALAAGLSGCTSPSQYIHNGFKVGPNYSQPPAPVAQHWIDAPDIPTLEASAMLCRWWTVFNDPKLNELVWCAYRQNLTLREAYFRVLQARAQLAIAQGEMFPQSQRAFGDYRRTAASVSPNIAPPPGKFNNLWDYGFNLQWELDFWGRLRRAVTAAEANLDASVAGYDGALVTMLGDIARSYVQVRTNQERIRLLQGNIDVQQGVLNYIGARLRVGKVSKLDWDQALSTLRQTEAQILPLEIDKRQQEDALCVLLGIPTVDLEKMLGIGPIPTAPPDVAVGIPCELLRRRPDVRVAERTAAAQAEQIGIAEADLYPLFTVNGTVGYAASNFPDLF